MGYGFGDISAVGSSEIKIAQFGEIKIGWPLARLDRSFMSKVIYKSSCWDCDELNNVYQRIMKNPSVEILY